MSGVEKVREALCDHGSKCVGNQWNCPAHEDRTPSLSVTERDGKVLVHCFAGCAPEDVIGALGLTWSDLVGDDERRSSDRAIVETYQYEEESGGLLFQVVRFAPKDFRQRRPDPERPGQWIWDTRGVPRVLYRLSRIVEAVKAGRTVWIVEGEKDVHAVERAGEVATTNAGGSGKWRPEYSEALRGANVVIIRDQDDPGRDHAENIRRSLTGLAASIEVVDPVEGKDAADHLGAGHGIGDFVPAQDPQEDPADPLERLGVHRIDVHRALVDPAPPVRWILPGFLEFGEVVNLFGFGKAGKSIAALALAIAALTGAPFVGLSVAPLDWVVYVDAENPDKTIKRRLHRLDVPTHVADALHLYSARGLNLGTPQGLDALDLMLPEDGCGLLVLDSAIALHRADENTAVEVRQVVSGIRKVAETRDASTIVLGHANRGGDLRGSLDWRNAADATLSLTSDADGVRTLSAVERRDGDEFGEVQFRFENIPHLGGGRPPSLALSVIGSNPPGRTKVKSIGEQLAELLAEDPQITQSEAARALRVSRDHYSFRTAWAVARAGERVARAGGSPPLKGGPPPQPPQRALIDGGIRGDE